MKILMANYRYFISGGPERYLFNLASALEENGDTVIPFSIKYTQNIRTQYDSFFVDPIGTKDEVYFGDQKKDLRTIYRTIKRAFYDPEVERKVNALVKETKPDVAYVLHFLRKMSPALLVGLKKNNIPIVVRISDFGLICPQAHFVRNDKICDLCMNKSLINSVKYKCVQNSFAASAINYLSTLTHGVFQLYNLIDKFVVTNNFMYELMIKAGVSDDRLSLVPTFVNLSQNKKEVKDTKKIFYIGRLERIKGLHLLINAVSNIFSKHLGEIIELHIIGKGSSNYEEEVRRQIAYEGIEDRVIFHGELNALEIEKRLQDAFLTVVPSLWYENLPNVVLESFASRIAVIAPNWGCFPELIADGKTGLLFEGGSPVDLANKIEFCIKHPLETYLMGEEAYKVASRMYNKQDHLSILNNVFHQVIKKERLVL